MESKRKKRRKSEPRSLSSLAQVYTTETSTLELDMERSAFFESYDWNKTMMRDSVTLFD
jgi:hypothetical protein